MESADLRHRLAEAEARAVGVLASGQNAVRQLQAMHAEELDALRRQVCGWCCGRLELCVVGKGSGGSVVAQFVVVLDVVVLDVVVLRVVAVERVMAAAAVVLAVVDQVAVLLVKVVVLSFCFAVR